jgi:hypothetical protein
VVPPPRLSCPKCGRLGQYRKQNLIGRYGRIFGRRLRKAATVGIRKLVRFRPKADIRVALAHVC